MLQVELSFVLMLLIGSCCAGVGRQRRLQMSASSTGHAAQAAAFGLPLWHATFATNDEYIETPFRRAQPAAQQQQSLPKHLQSNIYAEEQHGDEAAPEHSEHTGRNALDVNYALNPAQLQLLPVSELSPAQLQQLLLFHTPDSSSNIVDQPRHFHLFNNKGNSEKATITYHYVPIHGNQTGMNPYVNNVNNNNVTNVITTPAAAAAAAGTGTRSDLLRLAQLLPMQYFQTRQGQDASAGLKLPYDLLDLQDMGIYGNNLGLNAAAYSGLGGAAGFGRIGGVGPGVPLVPISLGNNAVGYVPLNLRMFRQLAANAASATATVPIREGENDATLAMDGLEQEADNTDGAEEDNIADKASGSRFQLFGMRQRPAAEATGTGGYQVRNPFLAFAKNMRRAQLI